jgi:hypothetical protein
MCAFPLHLWALLLSFRDFSWVSERTSAWDAVGVASYGLLIAFFESLVVFLIAALLGLLVSAKWDEPHRIALLTVLILILSSWAISGQAYFVWGLSPPKQFVDLIAGSGHPYRYLFGITFVEVVLTFAIPAILVLRSERFFRFIREVIDRLSLLTSFYLFFDLVGLIIIVIRNF